MHEKGNFLQIESQISNTSCIPVYPKCCSVCSYFKLNTLSWKQIDSRWLTNPEPHLSLSTQNCTLYNLVISNIKRLLVRNRKWLPPVVRAWTETHRESLVRAWRDRREKKLKLFQRELSNTFRFFFFFWRAQTTSLVPPGVTSGLNCWQWRMRGFRANTTEFLHTAYRLCVPNETRLPLGRSGVFRMKPIAVVIFRSNLRVLANAGGE